MAVKVLPQSRRYLLYQTAGDPPLAGQEASMRTIPVFFAVLGALGIAAAASPARADWDDYQDGRQQEWRDHQWREQRWREREWHERQLRAYAPPPAVVYAPPPAVYYAPPVPGYAAPPATYYAPVRPPVYEGAGVSVGFW